MKQRLPLDYKDKLGLPKIYLYILLFFFLFCEGKNKQYQKKKIAVFAFYTKLPSNISISQNDVHKVH